jgi:hypothetical protein
MQIARQIARRLQCYEGIQAIIVGGSVARGYADAYSDLEMPLFWDVLPSDAQRLQIVADLSAEFLYGYDGPANEDQVLIEGFQVDFWHCTVAGEEKVLEDVLTLERAGALLPRRTGGEERPRESGPTVPGAPRGARRAGQPNDGLWHDWGVAARGLSDLARPEP